MSIEMGLFGKLGFYLSNPGFSEDQVAVVSAWGCGTLEWCHFDF
jgi:hypothetical protein